MSWFRCTGGSGGSLKLRTASGAIASFETNLTALLNSLKCEITASGGNGSPDSPIPIVGHSELNLTRCGVNIWDGTGEDGKGMATNGDTYPSPDLFVTDYIVVKPNTRYYANGLNWFSWVNFYSNPSIEGFIVQGGINNGIVEVPENCYYARFTGKLANKATACINYPSSDTDYHTYNGQTFTVAFGQTVYGGVYDKSGRLTITHKVIALDQISWDYSAGSLFMASIADCALVLNQESVANWKCSCFPIIAQSGHQAGISGISGSNWFNGLTFWNEEGYTQATFETAISGQYIAYELATPIVIDVPSISVFAENGVNNVFSDIGDTEVKYLYKA